MCVRQEPGWDLQTLDLETLVNRLTTLLRNLQYLGQGSLKAGAYPQGKTTPTQARRTQDDPATTNDWRGQLNLQPTQARELIAAFRYFICRTDNHYVGSCSHAKSVDSPFPTVRRTTPEAIVVVDLPPVGQIPPPSLNHPTSSLPRLRLLLYPLRKALRSRPMPPPSPPPPRDLISTMSPTMETLLDGTPPMRPPSPPSRATVPDKPRPHMPTPTWSSARPRLALLAHVLSTAPLHRSLAAPQGSIPNRIPSPGLPPAFNERAVVRLVVPR
jgi:hypothetical protein